VSNQVDVSGEGQPVEWGAMGDLAVGATGDEENKGTGVPWSCYLSVLAMTT